MTEDHQRFSLTAGRQHHKFEKVHLKVIIIVLPNSQPPGVAKQNSVTEVIITTKWLHQIMLFKGKIDRIWVSQKILTESSLSPSSITVKLQGKPHKQLNFRQLHISLKKSEYPHGTGVDLPRWKKNIMLL